MAWCPSSGWFGANATASRSTSRAPGPRLRGLTGFAVRVDERGRVVVDFRQLTAGRRQFETTETTPAAGPDCATIPFDRRADLDVGGS